MESKEQSKSWFMPTVVLIALLLLYVLCFGPVVYVYESLEIKAYISAEVMRIIFWPHFLAMYHAEWYFDYAKFWLALADQPTSGSSYQDFRLYFESFK